MWKIPLCDLAYDEREQRAVLGVLEGKWLTAGAETAAFENEFAAFVGSDCHAVALSNCTAALALALVLSDISPGDEVIIPSLTFVAAINVVTAMGAHPVLADCTSLSDWNMSVDTIEPLITPRTKAVMVVHFAGMPCHMEPIVELCTNRGIRLIEDAAHAVGSYYNNRHVGSFGDVGCFSFFSNKNMAVGEGGMIVTRAPGLFEKARLLRSHGMTGMTVERHAGKGFSYDVLLPGYNYRIDEIRSALGRVQLNKLENNNCRREEIDALYRATLAPLNELVIPFQHIQPAFRSSRHIFPMLLPKGCDRRAFMTFLKEQGVQTSIHYPAMDTFTWYASRVVTPPCAAEISTRTVTLPLYPGMTNADVYFVCATVLSFFQGNNSRSIGSPL